MAHHSYRSTHQYDRILTEMSHQHNAWVPSPLVSVRSSHCEWFVSKNYVHVLQKRTAMLTQICIKLVSCDVEERAQFALPAMQHWVNCPCDMMPTVLARCPRSSLVLRHCMIHMEQLLRIFLGGQLFFIQAVECYIHTWHIHHRSVSYSSACLCLHVVELKNGQQSKI